MNNFFQNFGINFQAGSYYNNQNRRRKPQYFDVLKAYTMAIYDRPKSGFEIGNKILLPESALNQISSSQIEGALMYCLQNQSLSKQTFVGVLEYSADDGCIILPQQIFENLGLIEGQEINVSLVTEKELPKGQRVKIQPHKTEFIDQNNPRAILEYNLRHYACLHIGDTIVVEVMNRKFLIDIIDVYPKNDYKAICIINTDLEIEFAPPLDYVEEMPEKLNLKQQKSSMIMNQEESKFDQSSEQQKQLNFFQGKGVRVDKKELKEIDIKRMKEKEKQNQKPIEEYDPRKNRLNYGIQKSETGIQSNQIFQGKGTEIGKS